MGRTGIKTLRAAYAREVCVGISNDRIIQAFENVPRELFLGEGPWYRYEHVPQFPFFEYLRTKDRSVSHLYADASFALDPDAFINTGRPSVIANWIAELGLKEGAHVLQIGAGTGYYSAILAELVGPEGWVAAVEVRQDFVCAARKNLSHWPEVDVRHGDGNNLDFGPFDAIIVHAGVTEIPVLWLDRLTESGALVVSLTLVDERFPSISFGPAFSFRRTSATVFSARFLGLPYITTSCSLRGSHVEPDLRAAIYTGEWDQVRELRLDPHERDDRCWLHRERVCLSKGRHIVH
ncbi:MAG: methyltransferase domain-containing protein [Alphaproteobacteria bacterium]|nr:methyltransferase domain-containing protein [Alphaproteobacteria bacterium]